MLSFSIIVNLFAFANLRIACALNLKSPERMLSTNVEVCSGNVEPFDLPCLLFINDGEYPTGWQIQSSSFNVGSDAPSSYTFLMCGQIAVYLPQSILSTEFAAGITLQSTNVIAPVSTVGEFAGIYSGSECGTCNVPATAVGSEALISNCSTTATQISTSTSTSCSYWSGSINGVWNTTHISLTNYAPTPMPTPRPTPEPTPAPTIQCTTGDCCFSPITGDLISVCQNNYYVEADVYLFMNGQYDCFMNYSFVDSLLGGYCPKTST